MSFLVKDMNESKFKDLDKSKRTITDDSNDDKGHLPFDDSYSNLLSNARNIETLVGLIAGVSPDHQLCEQGHNQQDFPSLPIFIHVGWEFLRVVMRVQSNKDLTIDDLVLDCK